MKFIWLLLFMILLNVECTKFKLKVDRKQGAKCFFHRMGMNEKYSFKVTSLTGHLFRMDIMVQVRNKWQQVIIKTATKSIEYIQKMATKQGVHMFCISAINDVLLEARVEIMAGLEMMNFQNLPDLNDNQNLNRELDWLQKQKNKLFETIGRIDDAKASSENLKDMMSAKYVIFAILGLAAVVGVNFLFYKQAKKTLKDRKLI